MSRFFAEILVTNDKLTITGWLVTTAVLLQGVAMIIEIVQWVA